MQSLQAAAPLARRETDPGTRAVLRILRTDSLDASDSRLVGLLDAEEAVRARAFRIAADCASYLGAHALLRTLLTQACGGERAPHAWRFEAGVHGKPRLAAGPAFNLSHCRGM